MKGNRRLPRPFLLLALLSLAGVAASAWVLSHAEGRGTGSRGHRLPNIVLVSVDTLRADHLGCYGYRLPTSPAIDRFRADAVLFREAIAQASSTLPSHASMFTSLVPQHHGASHTQAKPLSPAALTLAEVLRDAGYETHAVVSGGQLAPEFGLTQGFDSYDELSADDYFRDVVRRGLDVVEKARKPFFLFLHTYEVHHPYTPGGWRLARFDPGYRGELPDEISVELLTEINEKRRQIGEADRRHIVATYDAEISSMDDSFGELVAAFEERGLYGEAVVVLTSDHGEEFGEHGTMGWHSHTLYDELLRVPLLLKLPGLAHAGAEVKGSVRGIDLAPTLLAAAGLGPPPQFTGRSLLPFVRRRQEPELPAIVWRETMPFETGTFSGVRGGGWKLHGDRLYDLASDPKEERDETAGRPEARHRLEGDLAAWLAKRRPLRADSVVLDESTVESLRSLGYMR